MERDGLTYTFEAPEFDPQENFLDENGKQKELDDVEEEDFENALDDVHADYSMAVEGINNLLNNIFPEMHGHHLHVVCQHEHEDHDEDEDAGEKGLDLGKP